MIVKAANASVLGPIGDDVDCYMCHETIPANEPTWGFTWGSDGYFPDGASAMYCCWNCRAFWIDPPEEMNE